MSRRKAATRAGTAMTALLRDPAGASAVEFAIICAPFLLLILWILQIGIYYFAQSALDNGVRRTAQTMYQSFKAGSAPTFMSGGDLKASIATNAGALIENDGTLAAEVRQIGSLSGGPVPIANGTTDYGTATSTLVVRAQSQVVSFAPGFGALARIRSSAIIRRQGT